VEQHDRTSRVKFVGSPVVNRFRRHHADAGVAMLAVVPGDELLADFACVLDAGEVLGKLRSVLERFELRFGKRIMVGDVWTGVSLATPRSANYRATGSEVIAEPRSM